MTAVLPIARCYPPMTAERCSDVRVALEVPEGSSQAPHPCQDLFLFSHGDGGSCSHGSRGLSQRSKGSLQLPRHFLHFTPLDDGREAPLGDEPLGNDLREGVKREGVILDVEYEDDFGFFIRRPWARL